MSKIGYSIKIDRELEEQICKKIDWSIYSPYSVSLLPDIIDQYINSGYGVIEDGVLSQDIYTLSGLTLYYYNQYLDTIYLPLREQNSKRKKKIPIQFEEWETMWIYPSDYQDFLIEYCETLLPQITPNYDEVCEIFSLPEDERKERMEFYCLTEDDYLSEKQDKDGWTDNYLNRLRLKSLGR